MKRRTQVRLVRAVFYTLFAVAVVYVGVNADWARLQNRFFNLQIAADMFPRVVTVAARNTLIFTVLSFSFGLILGLILALMRLSTIRPYRWFAAVYIEVFRGLPALLTIFLIGFGIPIGLGFSIPGRYGPGTVGLGLVAAAYMAETIRAGIEAVPRAQMEAARSLGMRYSRAMASIVVPQAFRIIIPPMTNELVLLLKDTSLLFVIGTRQGMEELTKFGRDVLNLRASPTPLIVVGLVYLAITIPMTRLVSLLERRARRAR